MLVDAHGRPHDYLRISLTDACNFRCLYCMPEEHTPCMPHRQLMSPAEIEQLARSFVAMGVRKIRLTGGEPLVRREFADILQRLAALPVELTLTTNGLLADKYLPALQQAGVRSLNVSLDTLRPDRFKALVQRDHLGKVWENLQLLLREGMRVKLNVVAMQGHVEEELLDFVQLTREQPLHVRFIEFMPFAGNTWHSGKVVTAAQLLEQVQAQLPVEKLQDGPHATAKAYRVPGYAGTFAFITTMSQHFCGDCNRIRLTADGKMKNCLFGKEETDLLGALRAGRDILPLVAHSLARKHAVMGGQFGQGFLQADPQLLENRSMIAIGG